MGDRARDRSRSPSKASEVPSAKTDPTHGPGGAPLKPPGRWDKDSEPGSRCSRRSPWSHVSEPRGPPPKTWEGAGGARLKEAEPEPLKGTEGLEKAAGPKEGDEWYARVKCPICRKPCSKWGLLPHMQNSLTCREQQARMAEHERSRCLAFAKKLQTEANQTADEAAGHLADLRLGSESGYGEKGGRREESGSWEEKRRPEIVLKEGPSAPKPYKCVGCGQMFSNEYAYWQHWKAKHEGSNLPGPEKPRRGAARSRVSSAGPSASQAPRPASAMGSSAVADLLEAASRLVRERENQA